MKELKNKIGETCTKRGRRILFLSIYIHEDRKRGKKIEKERD